jgi:hypothetical protein
MEHIGKHWNCAECLHQIASVTCDCGWTGGLHEPRCAKERVWWDTLEEHDEALYEDND